MRLEQWIYALPLRFRSLFRSHRVEQDLDEELQYHLDRKIEDGLARGLTREEAYESAIRAMDGLTQRKEECRDMRRVNVIENFTQDVRYGLRTLAKSPGFTTVAILTLALGIGSSTSIFSVVDAVLLRPLPYPNPERIVRVWEQAPNGHRMNMGGPNFDDLHAQNDTLGEFAAYGFLDQSVSGGSEPVRVTIGVVSSGFFRVFGIAPFRGRTFAPEEQRLHGTPAAIVSHHYWQRYLGGTADLSKCQLRMAESIYPVVGVMPPEFDYPTGVSAWIPSELDMSSTGRTAHNWRGIGRLRDGVSVARARANLSAIAHRIREQYGKRVDLDAAAVSPLADSIVGDVRTALLTLLGAAGLLLLVACANVAGLLLARTSARRRELAVRAALGAGRRRLVQQFLAESFALSCAGGGLGILLAVWAVKVLPAILPSTLPRQEGVAINVPVLLFAIAAIVALAVALGLLAAWRAGSANLQDALTAGSRGNSAGSGSQRLRGFLVAGEIATTLLILTSAGLLGRSFLRLIATNPGFRLENLIAMEFPTPTTGMQRLAPADIARQVHLTDQILARLRGIPGTESVALAGALPVASGDNLPDATFLILGGQQSPPSLDEWSHRVTDQSQTGRALMAVADDQYFHTLGLPLVRGRMFQLQDDWNTPGVAVVSEALVRQRWPNQDPVGQSIAFGNLRPLTIVGVVGDVRGRGLDAPPSPIVYMDYRQWGMNSNATPTVLMRNAGLAGEIIPGARRVFQELAPEMPVRFATFEEELDGWLADRRFLLMLVAAFAAAALALAAIGTYGVVAFSVARRTQEIGIRVAIGAQRTDVLRLVVGEGARLALIGVAVGIAASFAITRLLSSLLFGVSPTDPLTFGSVALLLSGVALFASYLPARRAMRLDPTTALRYD